MFSVKHYQSLYHFHLSYFRFQYTFLLLVIAHPYVSIINKVFYMVFLGLLRIQIRSDPCVFFRGLDQGIVWGSYPGVFRGSDPDPVFFLTVGTRSGSKLTPFGSAILPWSIPLKYQLDIEKLKVNKNFNRIFFLLAKKNSIQPNFNTKYLF